MGMKGLQLSLSVLNQASSPANPDRAQEPRLSTQETLAPGALLLRGMAAAFVPILLDDLARIVAEAPLRHMKTPSGLRMSVAMSNCGPLGWISDRAGYRYSALDPDSGRPWPALPASFLQLAQTAAAQAGFADFVPDACLINRYAPGAKLSLHQDKDERDFSAPIVSVSLGLPAVFLLGGLRRADRPSRHLLQHGDVVVFGGPSRLRYHGILPIQAADAAAHPQLENIRINLTLRKAR